MKTFHTPVRKRRAKCQNFKVRNFIGCFQVTSWQSVKGVKNSNNESLTFIAQELCESRGGRPELSVLTSLLVSVDVKLYWTVLRHWSQFVPNMSTDIRGHEALLHHSSADPHNSYSLSHPQWLAPISNLPVWVRSTPLFDEVLWNWCDAVHALELMWCFRI